MNMNGNIFIALLHSREPVGGPLLVVAHCDTPRFSLEAVGTRRLQQRVIHSR